MPETDTCTVCLNRFPVGILTDGGECPECAEDWQDDDSDSPAYDPGNIAHDH